MGAGSGCTEFLLSTGHLRLPFQVWLTAGLPQVVGSLLFCLSGPLVSSPHLMALHAEHSRRSNEAEEAAVFQTRGPGQSYAFGSIPRVDGPQDLGDQA